MLVKQIITEDTTAQTIISYLRKSPKVTKSGGKGQFQNDPDQIHSQARRLFREWCGQQGMKYITQNIMTRGKGKGTSKIAFYTFVGMMQRECGIPVTGVLDVQSMTAFAENAGRFNDTYITNRVERAIGNFKYKGCIKVVKAIENPGNTWGSTYASYHGGGKDIGIGPGQVEYKTYTDVKGGSFDYGNFDHVTSIDMLTSLMLEAIVLKMSFADRIAKKEKRDIATLEDFGRAWNYKHYSKAKSVYGKDIPMRPEMKTKMPPNRPNNLGKQPSQVDKTSIDKAVNKAMQPQQNTQSEPGYIDKLKTGLGNLVKGYFN